MIRMILIYTGLFFAAAIALWMKPDAQAHALASTTVEATEVSFLSASTRPTARPAAGLTVVSADAMQQFKGQNGLASLVVRELEQDASGEGLARLGATDNGAVDLAPLLDVPGSIRTQDGTRILASALMQRQGVDVTPRPSLQDEISNVATVAANPAPDMRLYTVKDGDSLASIARDQYGSTNAYREIFDANRDVLKSMDSIRVGQQLRLP